MVLERVELEARFDRAPANESADEHRRNFHALFWPGRLFQSPSTRDGRLTGGDPLLLRMCFWTETLRSAFPPLTASRIFLCLLLRQSSRSYIAPHTIIAAPSNAGLNVLQGKRLILYPPEAPSLRTVVNRDQFRLTETVVALG